MDDKEVEKVFQKYQELIDKDINLVPEPARTLMVIYTAQGIIGNGGFYYFFEANFPGTNVYQVIVESYRNIGLYEYANAIENLLSKFPNGNPHSDLKNRAKFLEKFFDGDSQKFLTEVGEAEQLFFSDTEHVLHLAHEYYSKN